MRCARVFEINNQCCSKIPVLYALECFPDDVISYPFRFMLGLFDRPLRRCVIERWLFYFLSVIFHAKANFLDQDVLETGFVKVKKVFLTIRAHFSLSSFFDLHPSMSVIFTLFSATLPFPVMKPPPVSPKLCLI